MTRTGNVADETASTMGGLVYYKQGLGYLTLCVCGGTEHTLSSDIACDGWIFVFSFLFVLG